MPRGMHLHASKDTNTFERRYVVRTRAEHIGAVSAQYCKAGVGATEHLPLLHCVLHVLHVPVFIVGLGLRWMLRSVYKESQRSGCGVWGAETTV